MLDNTTAIAYINSMGGRKSQCNQITRDLWVWCSTHNIWLTAVHIPGKQNVLADKESREKHSDIEWKLNTQLFEDVTAHWGTPSIDLFASRLNYQLKPFVSWRPDPEAMAIDAFSINWKENFYAFPPFALINRVLQKVEQDQSQGIIIVPLWTTQVWFPRLLHMLIDYPITLPKGPRTLSLPSNQERLHPLHKKTYPPGMQIIRNSLTTRGISEKAAKVILQSWRGSTQKQYSVYLNKWMVFCSSRGIDPYKATSAQALDFMTDLFEQGLGYSAMNTVRSALSQVLYSPSGVAFGELPIVKQFLKAIFQQKPALPRYTVTWDPSILLN